MESFDPNTGTGSVPAIHLSEIEGEPRVRDLDLAKRLGFDRPRKIRDLIARNLKEVTTYGPCPTVGRLVQGNPVTEYWLNEEQALLVSVLSDAPNAPGVRSMLIKVFVAWRRGHLIAEAPGMLPPRATFETFKGYFGIGRLIGLDRNQAAIAANNATRKTIGIDALGNMGTTHLIAPQQQKLMTPTDIGVELGGKSGMAVNSLLASRGFQIGKRDAKDRAYWVPTEAGEPYAIWQDTGKKHGDGTPVRQLKWSADVIAALQVEQTA